MKLKKLLFATFIITLPMSFGALAYSYFSPNKANSANQSKLSDYDLLSSSNIKAFKLVEISNPNAGVKFKNILDNANSKNKLIIINFWASWCSPCRKEVPVLNKFYKDNINKVEIIGIAADNLDNIKKFTKDVKVDYYLSIANIEAVELSKKLGNNIGGLPYTIVFRNNKIIDKHLGEIERKHLDNWLNIPNASK
jgi:thiol-disulfide isomerase/thioredoxin